MNARHILLFGFVLQAIACAHDAAAPETPRPGSGSVIDVPAQPAASDDAPIAQGEPVALPSSQTAQGDAGVTALPIMWSAAFTFGHTKPFAEAIAKAKESRRSFDRTASLVFAAPSATSAADAGPPGTTTLAAKDFEHASSLLDMTSRLYAAAYHAPNVTMQNRIDTLHDAGEMILSWSRKLDEVGLARAPATYRADPSIALTFEDVANGPAKRWREEGLAIVQLCVELATSSHLDGAASRDCAAMRQSYARVLSRPHGKAVATSPGDAGSPPACACDPGDPLCSASMSGWCRPTTK